MRGVQALSHSLLHEHIKPWLLGNLVHAFQVHLWYFRLDLPGSQKQTNVMRILEKCKRAEARPDDLPSAGPFRNAAPPPAATAGQSPSRGPRGWLSSRMTWRGVCRSQRSMRSVMYTLSRSVIVWNTLACSSISRVTSSVGVCSTLTTYTMTQRCW